MANFAASKTLFFKLVETFCKSSVMKNNLKIALLAFSLPLLVSSTFASWKPSSLLPKADENNIIKEGDDLVTEYVTPTRIVWQSPDGVENAENLLRPSTGQVSTTTKGYSVFTKHGAVVIDFGKELHGGIEIINAQTNVNKPVKMHVTLGESVTEAMSSEETSNATNEHAIREFDLEIPWLGSRSSGNSGFRFAKIELLSDSVTVPIVAIRAVSVHRDIPQIGTFSCDNERLNQIWKTGAYTVMLNMQHYLWDGIKRDRLVWIGDMHPEVMTINSIYDDQPVVKRSLDFVRDNTPLPGWMNGICTYSMWWILIHRDLYLYKGDLDYLKGQQTYMKALFKQIISQIDGNKEALKSEMRFLDWPTYDNPAVIHAGLQAITLITMRAGIQIADWLGDAELKDECEDAAKRLSRYAPKCNGNKQAASLLTLAGLMKEKDGQKVIEQGGAEGFSTFFGYYMLEALAKAGDYQGAMKIISDYWGAMLDLGATTFWEDFDYGCLKNNPARIDGIVPSGRFDVHKDGGAYCYVGMRKSLCHGWASGPTAWLTHYVLGVEPVEAGCKVVRIKPHLGDLKHVEGTFPTPYGMIKISHDRDKDGHVTSKIDAPNEITVLR